MRSFPSLILVCFLVSFWWLVMEQLSLLRFAVFSLLNDNMNESFSACDFETTVTLHLLQPKEHPARSSVSTPLEELCQNSSMPRLVIVVRWLLANFIVLTVNRIASCREDASLCDATGGYLLTRTDG